MTIYHLILESTLGLTTFRFVTEYLEARTAAAGVRRGLLARSTTTRRATSATASGSCARPCASIPEAAEAVRQTLRDLLPSVAEALGGAGNGSGPDLERLGVSTDEVREFALGGLTRRLDIIGVSLSSL